MDTWQLCPKCNGTGQYFNYNLTSITSLCDICYGNKIISKITGLPPNNSNTLDQTNLTNKMKRGYIDIEVIWNTDETSIKNDLGLDFLLSECEERKTRFFNISALNDFFETDNNKYTQIHSNGTTFYSKLSIDVITSLIIENL